MRLHPLTPFLCAIGLAALLAAPADAAKAQKQRPPVGVRPDAVRVVQNPNTVWYGSEYLGADPDPRIRHELLRDLSAHFGGNF